jgi:hypothetical protein
LKLIYITTQPNSAGLEVIGVDLGIDVDHIDAAAADHRAGREPGLLGRSGDLAVPGDAELLAERDMAHRLGGVAARLGPFGIDLLGGHGDRHHRQRRIDLRAGLGGQDRDALAQHRGLGLLALAAAEDAAAGEHRRHRQRRREREKLPGHPINPCQRGRRRARRRH